MSSPYIFVYKSIPFASHLLTVNIKHSRQLSGMARFAPPVAAAANGECPNLYVANCGPAVGVPLAVVAAAFADFGEVAAVHLADGSGARVVVCFADASAARAAAEAWGGGAPCAALGGRVLHIRYSVPRPPPHPASDAAPVALEAAELGVPGVFLVKDFVTAVEEQELIAAVDARPWKRLAKRRVQHYGYEFLYETRNVDWKQSMGELPSFVSSVLERIKSFPSGDDVERHPIDQLTVNEYYPGVGLSPHIDTHSAFGTSIFSLSLLGSCVMEFRKYSQGTYLPQPAAAPNNEEDRLSHCSNFIRKAIFLPPRSMLLMSGEGRYAWHHYIPHHKVDIVGEDMIRRSSRRVSFTFRKIRDAPCCCEYSQFCDSQRDISTVPTPANPSAI